MRATLLNSMECLYLLMFWKTSAARQVKGTTSLVMSSSLITSWNPIAHTLLPQDKLRLKIMKLTTISQIRFPSTEKRSSFISKINTVEVNPFLRALRPPLSRSNSNQPSSSLSTRIVSKAATSLRHQDRLQSHEQPLARRSRSAGSAVVDSWIRTDFCWAKSVAKDEGLI